MPRSCMVCWLMTSTVAGVSRAEMPRREETPAAAAVFNGVVSPAGGLGGLAAIGAVGLRPVARRAVRGFWLPGLIAGAVLGVDGETVTGPISTGGLSRSTLCAIAAADSDTEESREIRKRRQ